MPIQKRQGPAAGKPQKLIRATKGLGVSVGFFASAKYEDGTPVAYVAAVHEYGLGSPQRAFMRPTIAANGEAWTKAVVGMLKKDSNPFNALTLMGTLAMGDIQTAIATLTSPPLSEATLYARQHRKSPPPNKSKKPLVDTRYMLPSVQYEVIKK